MDYKETKIYRQPTNRVQQIVMAELNDGTEIELEKDCDCINHDGPHWLHMDRVSHNLNMSMLPLEESIQGAAVAHCFIKSEMRRLSEKEKNFERLNIKRIYYKP